MMRTVEPRDEFLLAQLDRMQAGMEKAQREISSGRRVNSASDAPDEVGEILSLRASLERNTQIRTNLVRVQSEVATADSTLQSAEKILESAAALAVKGGSDLSATGRQAIAEEVRGLQDRLVALTSTSVGDRYLFSGDLDTQPCYRLNLNAPDGVDRLAAPQATRQVQHPTGVSFTVSKTAAEVFDTRNPDGTAADDNAFAAINQLRLSLEAGDTAGIQAAGVKLGAASAHLNGELGFYGSVENRISSAIDDAGTLDVRLQAALSDREDADAAGSILELQKLQLNYSAALQMRGSLRQTSLFDYLK